MTFHLPLCTPSIYTISNSPFSFFMKFGKYWFYLKTKFLSLQQASLLQHPSLQLREMGEYSQHFVYLCPKFHRNELVTDLPSADFFAMCFAYSNYIKDISTSFPSSVLTEEFAFSFLICRLSVVQALPWKVSDAKCANGKTSRNAPLKERQVSLRHLQKKKGTKCNQLKFFWYF